MHLIDTWARGLGAMMVVAMLTLMSDPAPAVAQGQFSAVARVDGNAITAYDLDQRQTFLTLLRAPGDVRSLALDQLINETIQMREAKKAGIIVDDEQITAGMEEFASRGELTAEQLLQLLAQAGIAAETFHDFVAAGVTWREYLRATFLPRVTISQADIDAAMAVAVPEPGTRVLLSEIVLPAGDPASRKASRARAEGLRNLDEKEFADTAMRFSIGPSRNNGGKMKWLDLTALPPAVGAAVRGLQPGDTSQIIDTEDSVRLYYLHDREEVDAGEPRTVVEYAALLLPGGNAEDVTRIRAEATSCDDLYPIARGLAPEQLVRDTVQESQVPAAYAGELALLDPGEISSRVTTSSGAMTVLMLCSRGNELPRSLTREMVAEQLRNSRVTTLGQTFLDEQRANANIELLGN